MNKLPFKYLKGRKLSGIMEKNKNEQAKKITYIIILSIVLILFFTGYSIGKTISQTTIQGKLSLARPIIEVISDSNLKITDIENEGECNFSIRNYDEKGKKTEVNLQYTVEIKDSIDSKLKDTITYELYKNGDKVELQNQISPLMKLTNKSQKEDKYTLKVKYDKTKSTQMNDILEKIQIQVHSEQETNK